MLSEKQIQAKNLYFQTELTKTQIADLLNVSRRSLHYWIRENNWDRLKKSAATLPAMLAENCYVIIAKYTETLMSEIRIKRPVTPQEAETLHKLSLTVKKLKNHSTLNESMEMFAHFMERINKVSPQLADQVMPFVSDYIEERAAISPAAFKPEKLNEQGFIPYETEDPSEAQKDIADRMAWELENDKINMVDIEAFRSMDKDAPSVKDDAGNDATQANETSVPTAMMYQPEDTSESPDVIDQMLQEFTAPIVPGITPAEAEHRKKLLADAEQFIERYSQRPAA